MGERKVQSKYYPPDFDPSKVPRLASKKQNDNAVRFMLPMSVRCETCGDFMGVGTKFNARKSDTLENYLGVKIFRFSMKCKSCPATFIIKTDPKNSDYTCETGVRRNYEPWKDKDAKQEELKNERIRQDEDVIQALENKTMDAKKQMDDLDELQEIKLNNVRRAAKNVDEILDDNIMNKKRQREEEDQQLISEAKRAFETKRSQISSTTNNRSQSSNMNTSLQKVLNNDIGNSHKRRVKVTSFGTKLKLRTKSIPSTKAQQTPIEPALSNFNDYQSSSDDE